MSWLFFATSLLAFLFLDAIVSVIVVHGDEVRDELTSVSNVVRALIVSSAVSTVVACAVIQRLGWWDVVLRERRRARRWVWVVPVVLVATALLTTDYSRLQEAGSGVTAALLLATLLIGTAEELMFRGVVLQALRDRYREGVAAVATALLFGAFHLVAGPLAGISSAVGGYLYYATRQVSGGLAAPIAAHALWDFSVLSNSTTSEPAESASGPIVLFLVSIALLVLLVVRRKAVGQPATEERHVPEAVQRDTATQ